MMIIPAVDIRQGNSVRLKQGKLDAETIHSTDPVFIAKLMQAKGAKRIHIVDLDAALRTMNSNKEIIEKICKEASVPVEVGGGIRSMDKIKETFDMGASFVILGTAAVHNPDIVYKAIQEYGTNKIIIAIDAKDGKVAIGGWKDITSISTLELANKLKDAGVETILYTDISRDGMFTGPDYDGIKKLSKTGLKIIASGGVKSIEDLISLKKYEKDGVFAAVVGSALYRDDFKLEQAIKILSTPEEI
ncbi:MAG: 1-(5-phosphoribosyl)-5-[(5-phosphoribosylamino)methylideneamino]imidazole-4-carboxamide isomerase [Elusimicrobiota bacterium]|jgi:phosphoribosylformimino-5-aminoimidazole carboxamide ribotide isomerase|nr:1-(5-phosphoribosyl)-5-[(5-phosphoribosylamino)methylideneamino]imidazole-4-carboxamide isomerase [Elusimicrobiota bacterium]